MKPSAKTYVLLLAVLIVWGLIAYKIFQHIRPTNEDSVSFQSEKQKVSNAEPKSDYQMHTGYRDPFFGTFKKQEDQLETSVKATRTTVSKKPDLDSIPSVSVLYRGLVNPLANPKESVFIIEINGKTQLLKIGDSAEGCTLVSGNRQKVQIDHSGKKIEMPLLP